jgi:hypothetical protein
MALSITEKHRRIHDRMLQRFDRVWGATRDERLQCLQDRRFCFVPGAQWEGALSEQFENRPMLEMNKVRKAVNRIIAEFRQNRIEAKFLPRKESPANDSAADAATSAYRAGCGGLLGQNAKDNAFEESVAGGMGAWRLRPCYEDERDPANEYQKIEAEPIYDADVRVFMDDNALKPDKSDAKWGFILTPYTYEAYMDAFDDDDPATWTVDTYTRVFDWVTQDIVYVAEYYEIVKSKALMKLYKHLDGSEQRVMERDIENDPDLERWLMAVGAKKVAERTVEVPEVRKYIANGDRIIEDCGRIPGEYIPIIVTYGHRAVVDGIERMAGAVRVAKDPQRLKNMLTSKLAEISASGSTEKPIFFPEQVAGHTTMWSEDNIQNNPYLLINKMVDPVTGQLLMGPISQTKPPTVPQALGALLELAEFDIKDLLGSTEQAEKIISNVSEKAVSLVQQQIDLQSFIYVSSFQRAEKFAGTVWMSMAKEIYVEQGRKLRGSSAEGQPEIIELQKRKIDPKSGAAYISADFPSADLELEVSYGPTSTNKRTSTVRDLTGVLTIVKDPETASIIEALILMNMDGEGMSETRGYFRKKLLALGAVEPTDEERAQIEAAQANKPEAANDAYLRAAAENEVAKAIKARADTLLALAKAEEARAKAASIGADVDRSDVDQLVALSNELGAAQPGNPQAPTQPASVN